MARVLVLSNNVLADTQLQEQLQQLNYEVLVSSSIFTSLCYQLSVEQLLEPFHVIVFSETLTDEELGRALPRLKGVSKHVVRRTYVPVEEAIKSYWSELGVMNWSLVSDTPLMLRQLIESIISSEAAFLEKRARLDRIQTTETTYERRVSLLQETALTPTEIKLLQILYQSKGTLKTKEEVCQLLWNQSLSNSRKVQIYTLVGRIKEKLAQIKPNIIFLGAQRGNGYYLTKEFYDAFMMDVPRYIEEAVPCAATGG